MTPGKVTGPTCIKHGLCNVQSLLEGSGRCLQLALQEPIVTLKLPDQLVCLRNSTMSAQQHMVSTKSLQISVAKPLLK